MNRNALTALVVGIILLLLIGYLIYSNLNLGQEEEPTVTPISTPTASPEQTPNMILLPTASPTISPLASPQATPI